MGAILTAHTDFFHGTAERFVHLHKSWHGTANRGAETDVYGSARHAAKNLSTSAEPAPFTLSEFAVPCRKTAAPVPKYSPRAVPKTL